MAFAMTSTSFAPRTATLAPSARFSRARVAAPRRFSQLVRAEQSPIDEADRVVKAAEETISEVRALIDRQIAANGYSLIGLFSDTKGQRMYQLLKILCSMHACLC